MQYAITTATEKINRLQKRIRGIQGGTSAGKTVGVLQYLISLAQEDRKPTITSIVSESFPHLSRGAILDFLSIMKSQHYFKDIRWNKTEHTYTFETGSRIEFFSVDQPGKVRGPRRDRLFVNECNNIPYETFDQLEIRTREFVILDWNPVSEFWYYEKVQNRADCETIILTYRDNEALDPQILASIEQRRSRVGWWTVYGEGLLGEVEGKIYTDWKIEDELPHYARLTCYGIDFGYTNDPTAVVAVYYFQGGYIFDEIAYATRMSNKNIADVLMNQLQAPVVCDSAEPKSIDELKGYGIIVVPADKGKDSVVHGIQLVQQQRCAITKRSLNVIREYRNYLWETDRDGKVLNVPEHNFSHAMDAIRYALTNQLKRPAKFNTASPVAQGYYPDIGL